MAITINKIDVPAEGKNDSLKTISKGEIKKTAETKNHRWLVTVGGGSLNVNQSSYSVYHSIAKAILFPQQFQRSFRRCCNSNPRA